MPAELDRYLHTHWDLITASAGTYPSTLPRQVRILTPGQNVAKLSHGNGRNVDTLACYLAPHLDSGVNVCRWARNCTRGCVASKSGRQPMSSAVNARLWRTTFALGAPGTFRQTVLREVRARLSTIPRSVALGVRMDAGSDLGLGADLARLEPGAFWYDYTKSPGRALASLQPDSPRNYHLTFSHSGANLADCQRVLAAGVNVAVVFDAYPFPDTWNGWPVVSGDDHDARFLDPPGGHVIALRFKQAANRRAMLAAGLRTGFVQPSAPKE